VPPHSSRHAGDGTDSAVLAGPLNHLVEQLWSPLVTTGSLRITVGDTPLPEGWRVAEEYYVLPSVSRATMLIPAGPRAATIGSLLNYRGLRRPLPNLQRSVLGNLVRTGVPLPFPRLRVAVPAIGAEPEELPLAAFAARLEQPQAYAAIGVRTGANRKATLQLVDGAGAPIGFAKVAWDRASAEGIRRETAALAEASSSGPARRPRLLASGEHVGWPFLISEPLPADARGVRAEVPPPTPAEMIALTPVSRRAEVSATGQFRDLRMRLASLPDGDMVGPVRAAACRLLDAVAQCHDNLLVTTRCHGDLTPWNSARDRDGRLWCWDWESSEADAVAGLDALHWHVTVQTEGGRALDGSVLRTALDRSSPLLVAAGVPRRAWGQVAAVYCATLAERACDLASGAGGWEKDWVLPEQLLDLLSTSALLLEPV